MHVRGARRSSFAGARLSRRASRSALQVVSEGGNSRARGRVAAARSQREQRPADRSRHRHEIPVVFRPPSEQGGVADPPVPRGVRAVRHRRTATSTTSRATSALRATLIDLDTRMLGECRRIFANAANTAARLAEVQRPGGRAAVSSASSGRPAASRGRTATTCLSVGRLETVKRPRPGDSRRWRTVDPPVRLLLAGDGTQRENLEALADAARTSRDRVHVPGRRAGRGADRALCGRAGGGLYARSTRISAT